MRTNIRKEHDVEHKHDPVYGLKAAEEAGLLVHKHPVGADRGGRRRAGSWHRPGALAGRSGQSTGREERTAPGHFELPEAAREGLLVHGLGLGNGGSRGGERTSWAGIALAAKRHMFSDFR